ncbi:GNAT family N-acetyltransferase [Bacillus sp. 165]|uniref:GNAT family N-acetyltransferase n=1 Tax=Bacillus sp. 165 TaxID=1529117 RepID=UPI001ADC8EDA|nr:GNAT family N-acetyltransferase [Bacillus sp. 165]MBO9131485.1 GNAT family N-acetyltransferase [Bacillus sp. 165]
MEIQKEVIEQKRHYYCCSNFKNYIVYVGDQPAAIGSLFIDEKTGYIANDYTFEQYRGQGCQTALIHHRIQAARQLGLVHLYTDVEFASTSHNNMLKIGFNTVFVNSFWIKPH